MKNNGYMIIIDHMTKNPSANEMEATAKWMRDSLRIGGVKVCRELVKQAVETWNMAYKTALEAGPHNPEGTPERANQLARAYISGYLRTH